MCTALRRDATDWARYTADVPAAIGTELHKLLVKKHRIKDREGVLVCVSAEGIHARERKRLNSKQERRGRHGERRDLAPTFWFRVGLVVSLPLFPLSLHGQKKGFRRFQTAGKKKSHQSNAIKTSACDSHSCLAPTILGRVGSGVASLSWPARNI